MTHIKKLAVVNSDSMNCTYGGVAPFMRNMHPYLSKEFVVRYYHLTDGRKPGIIPGRLQVMWLLWRKRKELKQSDFIISHVPEGSFVISFFGVPYAHIYHGNDNPMTLSRYRLGIHFAFLFDSFFKRIKKTASIEYTVGPVTDGRKKLFNPITLPNSTSSLSARSGFLFAGRLEVIKNVNRLIEIYSLLPKSIRKDNPFYIAGFGSQESSLKQMVRDKGLEGQVVFLGNIDNSEVIKRDMSVRILLMASSREGLPTAIAEALSVGTPVVTTNPGDIPLVIKNGYNGFIHPLEFDNEDYIGSIMAVLNDFERFSKNALESSAVFNSRTITESVIRDINSIIGR